MTVDVQGRSWLLTWMDEHEATSMTDVERLLGSSAGQRSLLSAMEGAPVASPDPVVLEGNGLAAGAALDLSGSLDCNHRECLERKVDTLFQRAWHYFDTIAVVGPSAPEFLGRFKSDKSRATVDVKHAASMLLHIREIGAEPFLTFGTKRSACTEHLEGNANFYKVDFLLDQEEEWASRIAKEGEFTLSWNYKKKRWMFDVGHPLFPHSQYGSHKAKISTSKATLKTDISRNLWRMYAAHLVADIAYAKQAQSPLGTYLSLHEDLLSAATYEKAKPDSASVAFNLPLPYISGLPAKELLKIRRDNWPSFAVFRDALRAAIRERVAISTEGDSADRIAVEIANDLINPELNKISNEMDAMSRLAIRSTGLTLGLASISTTVGVLASAPAFLGPAIGAIVAGNEIKKYLADRKDIEKSEMYFLWKVLDKAPLHK